MGNIYTNTDVYVIVLAGTIRQRTVSTRLYFLLPHIYLKSLVTSYFAILLIQNISQLISYGISVTDLYLIPT